jgi:hypothetical protein
VEVPGVYSSWWSPSGGGRAIGGVSNLYPDSSTDYYVGANLPPQLVDVIWWIYSTDLLNACTNAFNTAFLHNVGRALVTATQLPACAIPGNSRGAQR